MTTKEISDASGKPLTVVRKVIKRLQIETSRGRTPQNFDQDVSKKILKALREYHPNMPGRKPKNKNEEIEIKKEVKKERKNGIKVIKRPLKNKKEVINEIEDHIVFIDEEEE